MISAGSILTLGISPALAPGKAAPYVIAAYIAFLVIVLVYVGIMALRLTRTERDLTELKRELEHAAAQSETFDPDPDRQREPVG